MEYNFTFYNPTTGSLQSVVGLVEEVYEDQIKIKYLESDNNKSNKSMNNNKDCICMLNPPSKSEYSDIKVLFIPIMNIVSVTHANICPNTKPEKNKKGGIHVMLLGISATTVKAIIIKLAFFDDNIEEAVKYVDLKVDGVYDLTYESNGVVYESRAKVIRIEEVPGDNHPCKPGKGFVREHVGCHNSIYIDNCKDHCSKDEFMQSPPVKKVKIVVDTSETFSGRFENIMLDKIRDCKFIAMDNSGEDEDDMDNTVTENNKPNNNHCGNHHNDNSCSCNKPEVFRYNYDNTYNATVIGDKVTLSIKGEKTTLSLEDLIKYYLGV